MSQSFTNTKWTAAQRRAIVKTDTNLLVSAAAGSGKTSVLAARCIHLICDENPLFACDIDGLLVVTFTRAAAAEMRSRIERSLRCRAAGSDESRLRRQLRLIDRAEIGTLHGFCGKVIRRHFNLLGIDPAFTTLDEKEALLLRNDVAVELFERRYRDDADGSFQDLIESHFAGNDSKLRENLLKTHALLGSLVDPQEWMQTALGRLRAGATLPFDQSEVGLEMMKLMSDHLASVAGRCAALRPKVSALSAKHGEFLGEIEASVDEWRNTLSSRGYDAAARQVREYVRQKLPKKAAGDDGDRAKHLVESIRKPLFTGWFAAACRFSSQEWQSGLAAAVAPAQRFLALVGEFTEAYSRAKREQRALDFSDLERMAFTVLRDATSDRIAPSTAALAYREQFRHVLVDEYQDINQLQDQILRLVSRQGAAANLFCVGDVKQSIYRFRLADAKQFIDRDQRYSKGVERGEVIPLSDNFRSDPPLLSTINALFRRLMTRPSSDIDYDDAQALHPGKKAHEYAPLAEAVELHVLPSPLPAAARASDAPPTQEFDGTEREAAVAAEMIQRLTAPSAAPRFDFGDIAVLLRTMKVKAEQFAAMLRRFGVPVHAEASSGFFKSQEIRDMLSLLQCLDNPRQDIPLAAVLRSPLVQLRSSDDALAAIRFAYRDGPFHVAVWRYSIEKTDDLAQSLKRFLDRLEAWRAAVNLRPLAGVVWEILNETGYLAFCSALIDGRQRSANLLFLHDRARQFGEFQKQGLRRFLRFLQSLEEETDLGLPSAVGDPGNVVRIMSIHQSKGLEFPVVLLPDLGKKFNVQDAGGTMIVDRDAGVCPQVVDLPRRARWDSLATVLAERTIRRQLAAEELRVLYVAMTRAQRKLIMLGTVDDPAEASERWLAEWAGHAGAIPGEFVLGARSMLEWIGPASAAVAGEPSALPVRVYEEADVSQLIGRAERRRRQFEPEATMRAFQPLSPAPAMTDAARGALEDLNWQQPTAAFSTIAAARAVTQFTKSGRAAEGGESPSLRPIIRFTPPLPMPRFLQPARSASPTEVGTATHRVLQAIDLACAPNEIDVRREIARLVERRSISVRDAESVDAPAIAWFLASELGALLRSGGARVFRELPIFAPSPPETSPLKRNEKGSDDPLDRVMLRGQIDALVQTADGLVVIDYKTDRVTGQTIDSRVDFYRPQVRAYCESIASITGLPVVSAHLVFLVPRAIVAVAPQRDGALPR